MSLGTLRRKADIGTWANRVPHIACLPESITREQVKPLAQGILAWGEELKVAVKSEFVFRDSAFADDVAKTNLASYLEQNLPESQRGRLRSL